jgi:hypothetical protein
VEIKAEAARIVLYVKISIFKIYLNRTRCEGKIEP